MTVVRELLYACAIMPLVPHRGELAFGRLVKHFRVSGRPRRILLCYLSPSCRAEADSWANS